MPTGTNDVAPRQPAKVMPFPAPLRQHPRVDRYPLPAGDAGVRRTVMLMRGLVAGRDGSTNPDVRTTALQILANVDPRGNDAGMILTLFTWVQKNIKFIGESGEFVQSPIVTLKLRAGDCDDQAALLAALLRTVGIRARFVTVAADPSDPKTFTHVYTEAYDRQKGTWVSLDTTVRGATPGWKPSRITRRRAWRTMGDPPPLVAGQDGTAVSTTAADIIGVINAAGPAVANTIAAIRQQPGFSFYGSAGGYTAMGTGYILGIPTSTFVIGAVGLGAIVLAMRRNGR